MITKEFEYDHAGRLLRTYQTISGYPKVLLSALKYDELGQLKEKYLYSKDIAQDEKGTRQRIDYKYIIRGWLTGINDPEALGDDLFAQRLFYGQTGSIPTGIEAEYQFNGNISAVMWNINNDGVTGVPEVYGYKYDAINRLIKADYGAISNYESSAFDVFGTGTNNSLTYDLNGNILSLKRNNNSGSQLDNISFTY